MLLYDDAFLRRREGTTGGADMDGNDERVFNQDCAAYLRSMGIAARDGESINCPFRDSADSGSFGMSLM